MRRYRDREVAPTEEEGRDSETPLTANLKKVAL